jgi:hypothetical protein
MPQIIDPPSVRTFIILEAVGAAVDFKELMIPRVYMIVIIADEALIESRVSNGKGQRWNILRQNSRQRPESDRTAREELEPQNHMLFCRHVNHLQCSGPVDVALARELAQSCQSILPKCNRPFAAPMIFWYLDGISEHILSYRSRIRCPENDERRYRAQMRAANQPRGSDLRRKPNVLGAMIVTREAQAESKRDLNSAHTHFNSI